LGPWGTTGDRSSVMAQAGDDWSVQGGGGVGMRTSVSAAAAGDDGDVSEEGDDERFNRRLRGASLGRNVSKSG